MRSGKQRGLLTLPDASVRESRDRVKSAIRNSGFPFPAHRVTVNLAPADVRKAGASYDLPIALCILAAMGVVPPAMLPPDTEVMRRALADLAVLEQRLACAEGWRDRLRLRGEVCAVKASIARETERPHPMAIY